MNKEKDLRKLQQEIEEVRERFGIEFAEVKHGRWISSKKHLFGKQENDVCSNCRSATGIVNFNYCPNCGAKMDGGA
jgi:hypothetical protein